jgi:acyl-CoA synthetase (AMP-forming)/AMP-acid ligase II
MSNIVQLLFDQNRINSSVWQFPVEDICVSVSELGNRVKNYAAVLKNNDIEPGDRVGYVLDNSYDMVCLLYATWYLNAVAVPLRPRSGRYHDYRKYIDKCDDLCDFKLVIFEGESISDELSCWAAECNKSVESVQAIADSVARIDTSDSFQPVNIAPQDIAIIQFSSGSTGDPKGVVVTHKMMMAQLRNIEDNHARSRGTKVASSASWLPINHDMGLFIGVLSPIFSACNNLLSTPGYYMKNPPRWFRLLSEHGVDFTFSTNSVLASSLDSLHRLHKTSGKQVSVNLSNLHLYVAAEKVSPVIVRRTWDALSELGCPNKNIHVGYGMAENTLGATYTTAGPIKIHWFVLNQDDSLSLSDGNHPQAFELASIGIANDHHVITVRDRHDAILSELSLGEFSIESPCVSPAYYNNTEATALKFANGRLRTGDLGFRYNGEYYFYSRADDLIITGGRNVVPDDIETTVESLDFVRSGGSVLLATENLQSGVVQLQLLIEGNARLSCQDIASRCVKTRQHVLDHHDLLVKDIVLCAKGSIEKTSSGKKRRKVIRQRLLDAEICILPQRSIEVVNEKTIWNKPTQGQSVGYGYQESIQELL